MLRSARNIHYHDISSYHKFDSNQSSNDERWNQIPIASIIRAKSPATNKTTIMLSLQFSIPPPIKALKSIPVMSLLPTAEDLWHTI